MTHVSTPPITSQHAYMDPLLDNLIVPACGGLTGGRGAHRTWRPKFRQGFPPIFQNLKLFLACCSLRWDPNSLPALPPCAHRHTWGG